MTVFRTDVFQKLTLGAPDLINFKRVNKKVNNYILNKNTALLKLDDQTA